MRISARKVFIAGGLVSSVLLVAVGVALIVMGVWGRSEVRSQLRSEQIYGTEDSSIAGQLVDTGAEAKVFADTIKKHALEAAGGKTYAQLGRYLKVGGGDTNNPDEAVKDANGNPVANPARNTWVTATALRTALYMSYFAEQVSTFSIVMGVVLIVTGGGFGVLTLAALWRPAIVREEVTSAVPAHA
ncbi:hypothetical protein HRbin29_02347 [bacterium HR29]|jgi:hypothetical protein|nr:hypothetical protein HRbin29_02347 [bacterium HR29]